MKRRIAAPSSTLLNLSAGLIFVVIAVIAVVLVNRTMRQQALVEAQSKARVLFDRHMATHTYYSEILKPNPFESTEPLGADEASDPSWMSSFYAIRKVDQYFQEFSQTQYYVKDAAINARRPENEADAYERAFLEEIRANPQLKARSTVRNIEGQPYLAVLRPGLVMEESCLRCHGDPADAPDGLVDYYGAERGFHREGDLGSVVLATSIRVPLADAYGQANRSSLQLSGLLLLLAVLFAAQFWLHRRLVFAPLDTIRAKALQISTKPEHLGEEIPVPLGQDLANLADTFNRMSVKLRQDRDQLEKVVKERTRELQEAREQLIRWEKLAVLGQLAGGVGHELRNPLGIISNAVYFLKLVLPDAGVKTTEYLGIIENETRNAEKIVADLLDFSRSKSADREPVAAAELARRVLERYPAPAAVTVSVQAGADLPRAYADPRQMAQVLGNLVVNACQAMPQGGRLTISATRRGKEMSIAVADTGVGIAPENMARLFEPLFTTKPKGIGLGLAVSKSLVEANGGRIEVQSAPGVGSTFTLYLPLHQEGK